ncbi:MAG: (Fe-S)-binding protein [bacterium]
MNSDGKDFVRHRNLYPQDRAPRHLRALLTDLGERGLYDAVSQCNRCGYCAPVCPTQAATGRETLSGRGRNQAVRMLMEGRLGKMKEADEAIFSCLLCGACVSVCYAKVPTPDIVLEARRSSDGRHANIFASAGMSLLLNHPSAFANWLRFGNLLRKLGLPGLAGKLGIYHLLGMPGLAQAQEAAPSPLRFLFEKLARDKSLARGQAANSGSAVLARLPAVGQAATGVLQARRHPLMAGGLVSGAVGDRGTRLGEASGLCPTTVPGAQRRGHAEQGSPRWIYFSPCGPNYMFPGVGLSTVSLLKRFLGNGIYFGNACCGLLSYNYGDIRDARTSAMRNIEKFEQLVRGGEEAAVLVGDCSSCVAFMKSYEQLFAEDPLWRPRARRFAEKVKDVLEIIPEDKISRADLSQAFSPCNNPKSNIQNPISNIRPPKSIRVTYHDSCRACHGQGIRKEPRLVLEKILGKHFVEMPESDWCCGGAGTFAFTQPALSSLILRRKISNIASVQADVVLAGSTSCLIQLAAGLKKMHTKARVMHYSVFIDNLTREK